MRKLVIEIIDNAVFFLLLFGLFATIYYYIIGDASALWRLGFLVIPFGVNFYLRRVIKTFGILLVSHLIFPVAVMFIAPVSTQALWLIFAVLLSIFSLLYFFKRVNASGQLIAFSALMLIALSFWMASGGHWTLVALYPVLMVLIGTGRIIVMHMLQMDKSLDAIQPPAAQKSRIISFNYKLMAGLGAAMIALTMAIYLGIIAPVAGVLIQNVPELQRISSPNEDEPIQPMPSRSTMTEFLMPYGDYAEPSTMWQLLDVLFRMAGTIIIFGIIVFVLFMLVRAIIRLLKLRAKSADTELQSDWAQDEREFILPQRARTKRGTQQEEPPIRRLFRETIQAHIKRGVPIQKSDTPTDITHRIHSEDIAPLAEAYAQVRYGKHSILEYKP